MRLRELGFAKTHKLKYIYIYIYIFKILEKLSGGQGLEENPSNFFYWM